MIYTACGRALPTDRQTLPARDGDNYKITGHTHTNNRLYRHAMATTTKSLATHTQTTDFTGTRWRQRQNHWPHTHRETFSQHNLWHNYDNDDGFYDDALEKEMTDLL